MLIVDREFERRARDVVFVPLVKLDRERIHLAKPVERLLQQRSSVLKVGPHVWVEPGEIELGVARHRKRIAVEVHEDFSSRLRLLDDGEIDEARTEVQHSSGMERPLVAFAKHVRRQLLRRAIIVR